MMKKWIALLAAVMMLCTGLAFAEEIAEAVVAESAEENVELVTGEDAVLDTVVVTASDDAYIANGLEEGTSFSITVDVPEGYTMVNKTTQPDTMYVVFTPADNSGVEYTLAVAYSELFGDYTLNDLTEDELQDMKDILLADYNNPTVDLTRTTAVGTKLIVAEENDAESDYAMVLTIYHGYFVEIDAFSLDHSEITAAEVDTAIGLMSSLAIVTE